MWAFPLVFVGFAILAGLWPFHTWAPTGHVAAPTAASMLLAGVVMKLGAYGCLRVAMTLFPLGLDPWGFHILGLGSWRDVFALLGRHRHRLWRDGRAGAERLQIRHRLLQRQPHGLRPARPDDPQPHRPDGAVLQMFSHGIIAGLLFAVVGRMVYDRTHTRDLAALETMHLSKVHPFAAVTFVLAGMASMGLPGFSGFVAELRCSLGAWRAFPAFAILAGLGILIGVAYTWRAMQKAFFYRRPRLLPWHDHHELPPITLPEKIGAVLLICISVAVGLFPQVLINLILPALNSPLFDGLRRGSGQ